MTEQTTKIYKNRQRTIKDNLFSKLYRRDSAFKRTCQVTGIRCWH